MKEINLSLSLSDMICCCCHEWILLQRKQGLTQNREARSLVDGRGSCATSTPTLVVPAAARAVAWVHNLRMIKWIDFCLILSELHRQSFSTQNCKSLPSAPKTTKILPSFRTQHCESLPFFRTQNCKFFPSALKTVNPFLQDPKNSMNPSFSYLYATLGLWIACLQQARKKDGYSQQTTTPVPYNHHHLQSYPTREIIACVFVCVCGLFVCVRSAFHPFVFLCLRLLSWRAAAINLSQRYCFCLSREREREEEENYSH